MRREIEVLCEQCGSLMFTISSENGGPMFLSGEGFSVDHKTYGGLTSEISITPCDYCIDEKLEDETSDMESKLRDEYEDRIDKLSDTVKHKDADLDDFTERIDHLKKERDRFKEKLLLHAKRYGKMYVACRDAKRDLKNKVNRIIRL